MRIGFYCNGTQPDGVLELHHCPLPLFLCQHLPGHLPAMLADVSGQIRWPGCPCHHIDTRCRYATAGCGCPGNCPVRRETASRSAGLRRPHQSLPPANRCWRERCNPVPRPTAGRRNQHSLRPPEGRESNFPIKRPRAHGCTAPVESMPSAISPESKTLALNDNRRANRVINDLCSRVDHANLHSGSSPFL